jgi:tRNA dimethylallyltransferase
MSPFERALILTGPTASGKTALGLELAERVGAEIIALDSMTVYRGMDIGTAKPTAAERARVPHHLIDVLDPWESLTVALWLERARAACQDIVARDKRPLFVGGTPFYLKALLHGLFPGPPADEEVRRKLEAEAAANGAITLHERLATVDPKTAARLHANDVRRVVRALEVHTLTGKPISEWQKSWDTPAFADVPAAAPPLVRIPGAVLELPREELHRRIDRRVEGMLAAGWLDEVRRLQELPRPLSREARQALGYRELLAFLGTPVAGLSRAEPASETPPARSRLGWQETVELIRTHTRQFAKRQMTWFRHMPQLVPVSVDAPGCRDEVLKAWGETSGRAEIDTLT